MATQLAFRTLHYSCTLVISLYLVISILFHRPPVKKRKSARFKRRIRPRVILIALIVFTYVSQTVLDIATDDLDRSQPFLVHMTSQAVVWSALWLRQQNPSKYEVAGASFVTAGFEAPLLALSLYPKPTQWAPITQTSISAARLALLVCVVGVILLQSRQKKKKTSDEARPFLNGNRTGYGALDGNRSDNSSLESESESETDTGKDKNDAAARKKRLRNEQLQTLGGWWEYLKGFSIFLPYLVPRSNRNVQVCIATSVFCLACHRVLNILIPQQLADVTDSIFAHKTPYTSLGKWALLQLIRGGAGLGLIEALVKIPIRQFSYRQITNAAFSHVMNLSMDFHIENDSAEVMKSIDQGGALNNLLEVAILDIAPTIADLCIACVVFYLKFNAYASLLVVVVAILYVSVEVFTSNWNMEFRRELTQAQRTETRIMHQAVQGWQTVTYFNQFSHERSSFGEAVDVYLKASARFGRCRAIGKSLMDLLKPICFVGLSSLIVHEISVGRSSTGDFVFFIQYWSSLISPLTYLSAQYRWLVSDLVDAERLLFLFQSKPSVTDKENAVPLKAGDGRVTFHHVNFAYDSRLQTLNDVDISIDPGTTVALVGMTGSGKTTMLRLLLRLYDVTSGRIEIDGQDIRDITLSSLRQTIGVVPQDPVLFNASIIENLRYARPSASDEEVHEACRAAAIHEKILTFVDGYDTTVGEQGVKLSGGELQRIAIARVFLKKSPILLLDEATSAVDSSTEADIQVALDRLRTKRTTFVIAHRLSTISGADQILVMHEGQIVESGSHTELLKKEGGRYQKLWRNQFGGIKSEKPAL
jgi:ABC-type transport system involved in Fe-S cluster assembly fused permease/ATPase subunit